MNLDEIGKKHGTDKSSIHHNYLVHYQAEISMYFQSMIKGDDLQTKLLEIGVQGGKSIHTWEEAWPGDVYGIDIDSDCLDIPFKRAIIELVDQSDIGALEDFGTRHGPFDVIIDDGSHQQEHQKKTFCTMFPYYLKPGGLYVIEDIACSYERYWGGGYKAKTSTVEFVKDQIDELCCAIWGGTNPFGIEAIHFYKGVIFIWKQGRKY